VTIRPPGQRARPVNLGVLEPEFTEMLTQAVRVCIHPGHDEQDGPNAHSGVDLLVFTIAMYCRLEPESILLDSVRLRHPASGVLDICADVVRTVNDDRRLDDPVLDGLSKRVVHHRPREVVSLLVPGRGREVEPQGKPLGKRVVDRAKRLVPLQAFGSRPSE